MLFRSGQMEYYIKIGRQKVPVSEAVYKEWCRGERKERYFKESDIGNNVFSYDALDTDEINGCDMFASPLQPSTEFLAERHILLTRLADALLALNDDERLLLCRLYADGLSLRRIASESGIPLSTLQYRHQRILKNLRGFFEHAFDSSNKWCNVTESNRKTKEKRRQP